jgi:hypothetical protein
MLTLKIDTSIISKGFESFMPDIIDEDHTGFIKGRQAQDNIRKTIHIEEEVKRRGKSVVLVSLDTKRHLIVLGGPTCIKS